MSSFTNQAFDSSSVVLKLYSESLESEKVVANNHAMSVTPTEMVTPKVPAVEIKNAYKSYGSGKKKSHVMFNLNMTVKQGTIYSLLGSSGCGKTTLLSCIVGVKNMDSGRIRIFGSKAGSLESGVPGARIGFMPQDIALYNDFSIKETIDYFGNLYGMERTKIDTRRKFLSELLSLPDDFRRVGALSGGQKRRVSLAVALVHSPPLIILDEPTVGVDPLLREIIWNHLRQVVSEGKTTVIITTHYIEEAACSDTVGIMRGGHLLTEKSPAALYEEYKTSSLQDVVLHLCHKDEKSEDNAGRQRSKSSGNILHIESVQKRSIVSSIKKQYTVQSEPYQRADGTTLKGNLLCFSNIRDSLKRIRSLTTKNFFVMLRNIMLVVFVIMMPAIQVVIMGFSMGKDPSPLHIGVVNHEMNETGGFCIPRLTSDDDGCDTANLSCRFLESIPSHIVILSNYESEELARIDVEASKIRGFMSFPEGYSNYMFERSTIGVLIENETLAGSSVTFQLDASNTVITKSIQRIVYEAYTVFVRGLLTGCGFNPDYAGIPVKFENPIYGSYDMELQEFVAAGMLVGVALFFPLCSSTITYLWDKKQGTMERARVAGTKTWEIMISYFISEGFVLILQTCTCLVTVTQVFHVKIVGSIWLAFALVALNGIAGISLGLLIASLCNEEIQAILLALAIMMPNFYLTGVMWPIEALPKILQHFSLILPGNLASEAFRSIVIRGWGITHYKVWSGFAATSAWVCVYWVVSIYVHKIRLAKQ